MNVMRSRRYAGRAGVLETKHLLCFEFYKEVNHFTQGPPQPAVDGSAWDFGDVRRWEWMHDGYEVNGWIEFRSGGVLRTSFEKKDGNKDVWCYTTNGNIIATFGNCHHYLKLSDEDKPEFYVFERILLNGDVARGQCQTRGVLATLTPRPPSYAPSSALQVRNLHRFFFCVFCFLESFQLLFRCCVILT